MVKHPQKQISFLIALMLATVKIGKSSLHCDTALQENECLNRCTGLELTADSHQTELRYTLMVRLSRGRHASGGCPLSTQGLCICSNIHFPEVPFHNAKSFFIRGVTTTDDHGTPRE
jgi:hypothetical protein